MQMNYQPAGLGSRSLLLPVERRARAVDGRKTQAMSNRTGTLAQATLVASRGWYWEAAAWLTLGLGAGAVLLLSFWG